MIGRINDYALEKKCKIRLKVKKNKVASCNAADKAAEWRKNEYNN